MPISNYEFAMSAHPHSWFLVADNLYQQAVELHTRVSAGYMTQFNGVGEKLECWPSVNRSIFLLAGFALENAVKAFLVYENPEWVSNGRLVRTIRSHSLVDLASKSKIIPWPVRGVPILTEFERGLESWARYPCALSANETETEQVLTESLWNRYTKLMRSYGLRMKDLLGKGWAGPHGINGHFKIEGDYLGAA